MTIMIKPNFIDSPYFVPEFDNWHLKPGAPEEVVKEFNEWMKAYDEYTLENKSDPQLTELRKWQSMAEKRVKEGKALREFESSIIEPSLHGAISGALEGVKSVDEIKRIFDSVIEWRVYP